MASVRLQWAIFAGLCFFDEFALHNRIRPLWPQSWIPIITAIRTPLRTLLYFAIPALLPQSIPSFLLPSTFRDSDVSRFVEAEHTDDLISRSAGVFWTWIITGVTIWIAYTRSLRTILDRLRVPQGRASRLIACLVCFLFWSNALFRAAVFVDNGVELFARHLVCIPEVPAELLRSDASSILQSAGLPPTCAEAAPYLVMTGLNRIDAVNDMYIITKGFFCDVELVINALMYYVYKSSANEMSVVMTAAGEGKGSLCGRAAVPINFDIARRDPDLAILIKMLYVGDAKLRSYVQRTEPQIKAVADAAGDVLSVGRDLTDRFEKLPSLANNFALRWNHPVIPKPLRWMTYLVRSPYGNGFGLGDWLDHWSHVHSPPLARRHRQAQHHLHRTIQNVSPYLEQHLGYELDFSYEALVLDSLTNKTSMDSTRGLFARIDLERLLGKLPPNHPDKTVAMTMRSLKRRLDEYERSSLQARNELVWEFLGFPDGRQGTIQIASGILNGNDLYGFRAKMGIYERLKLHQKNLVDEAPKKLSILRRGDKPLGSSRGGKGREPSGTPIDFAEEVVVVGSSHLLDGRDLRWENSDREAEKDPSRGDWLGLLSQFFVW